MRFGALFVFFVCMSFAQACLWDHDTLAMEARGMPDVIRVISGRFERNPPLYLEMRLKRVTEELAKDPTKLENYDDAGVACGRLMRDAESLEWMAKKLKVLEEAKARGVENKDHWYRYHANLGTFLIHRWLHEGAKKERISEAVDARNHIAQAIKINPDAHFGREYMQLAAMDAIIAVKTGKAKKFSLDEFVKGRTKTQMIEGVCGLIVLGAAWESVDIYNALADYLNRDNQSSVSYLAVLRRDELLSEGKKPIVGTADEMRKETHFGEMRLEDHQKLNVQETYDMLRKNANDYHDKRTAYMMARLKAGRHPDTDSKFWDEWKEPPMPVLRDWKSVIYWPYGPAGSFVAVWVVLMVWAIRRRMKQKQAMME